MDMAMLWLNFAEPIRSNDIIGDLFLLWRQPAVCDLFEEMVPCNKYLTKTYPRDWQVWIVTILKCSHKKLTTARKKPLISESTDKTSSTILNVDVMDKFYTRTQNAQVAFCGSFTGVLTNTSSMPPLFRSVIECRQRRSGHANKNKKAIAQALTLNACTCSFNFNHCKSAL